jgi:predicted DNA-binding WGR domain protein
MATKGYLIDKHCNVSGDIVEKNGYVYSCTLNQTDIKTNKNKFYIMQIINDNSGLYTYFTRYGRIGEIGVSSHTQFSQQNDVILTFEKIFKTKTGNNWNNQKNFVKKIGKYYLSDISYEQELSKLPICNIEIKKSKLDIKVQQLLQMLGDIDMMNNALISLNIDPKKMPLGKLSKKQLDSANDILTKLTSLVEHLEYETNTNKQLELKESIIDLSSNYYTYIPYSCGRRKPPLLNNGKILSENKGKIEELKNIVISGEIVNNTKSTDKNPIDSIYDDINTNISPLDPNSEIYKEIILWVKNTHGSTHGSNLNVLDIFEIEQHGVREKYNNYSKNLNNKTLLFHGTHQSCVLSIFKNNFYLDPSKIDSNIQIAGKMFGYGVYWADVATKSFNYTRAQSTNDIGCLLVGEIALGNILEKKSADCCLNKNKLDKSNCHSTKALGKWQPMPPKMIDGITINNGPLTVIKQKTDLRYNEYIVYDINQIFVKYLITVKNTGNYNGY